MTAPAILPARRGALARHEPPWRGLLGPAVATALALAILVALGIWQLERKGWKEGLLAQIQDRAYGPAGDPVPESAWPNWSAETDEFRRVRLTGQWLGDRTVPIHGLAELRRAQASQGFYLFTPLRLAGGGIVVINRGFVPTETVSDTLTRLRGQNGPADLIGLVRAPEERGWFVPENRPDRDEWFVRNIRDIAAFGQLVHVAPFYVDQDAATGGTTWPVGGQTQLTLRNNHLQYAFTWFGLGAALVGVFVAFASRKRVSGDPSSPM